MPVYPRPQLHALVLVLVRLLATRYCSDSTTRDSGHILLAYCLLGAGGTHTWPTPTPTHHPSASQTSNAKRSAFRVPSC
jgi:hypothetical protein